MVVAANDNFLVPDGTFVAELIAFLIILGIIGKFVLPPLRAAMDKRREEIRSSLEAAESARAEADESRQQRQVILDEARSQAREILAQAGRTSERMQTEAQTRGQLEYERLVAGAATEIAAARQRAIEDVSGQVATLVLSVSRQVIGREIDAERHRDLVDEAVAALRASARRSTAGAPA
jgi:F-type H+-transporting ATPase subunit b